MKIVKKVPVYETPPRFYFLAYRREYAYGIVPVTHCSYYAPIGINILVWLSVNFWLTITYPARRYRENLEKEIHAELDDKHRRQIRSIRERHNELLTRETQTAKDIVDRLSKINFNRRYDRVPGDVYQVTVEFDSRMFGGFHPHPMDRNQHEFIADRISRQIREEIASSKFVQSAREDEINRIRRRHEMLMIPPYPPPAKSMWPEGPGKDAQPGRPVRRLSEQDDSEVNSESPEGAD